MVSVQSMLKSPLDKYTSGDFKYFYNLGCDYMRFSITNENQKQIEKAVLNSPIPLIADIQGNINQAFMAINSGCAAIRINPGNFPLQELQNLLILAKEKDVWIRIGINTASLGKGSEPLDEIKKYLKIFNDNGFKKVVVSIKSSSLQKSLELNIEFKKQYPSIPLHIGLTEAGITAISSVRSTILLSSLLNNNIGSTLRYSISGTEEDEILAGVELLKSLGLRKTGVNLISCPMCARHSINTNEYSKKLLRYIYSNYDSRKLSLKLAVMGCSINGRGEAEGADVAICALSSNKVEIYLKGSLQFTCALDEVYENVVSVIDKLMGV